MSVETITGILIYAVAATLLPVGGICIVFGVIGKQISDHPCCRACHFDLFGTWPRSKVCPECGSSLAVSHSVVNGIHVMRKGLIAAGVALFLLGLSMHVSYFYAEAIQFTQPPGTSNTASTNTPQVIDIEVGGSDEP